MKKYTVKFKGEDDIIRTFQSSTISAARNKAREVNSRLISFVNKNNVHLTI